MLVNDPQELVLVCFALEGVLGAEERTTKMIPWVLVLLFASIGFLFSVTLD